MCLEVEGEGGGADAGLRVSMGRSVWLCFIIPADHKGWTQSVTLTMSLAAPVRPSSSRDCSNSYAYYYCAVPNCVWLCFIIPAGCVALFYYTGGSKGWTIFFIIGSSF